MQAFLLSLGERLSLNTHHNSVSCKLKVFKIGKLSVSMNGFGDGLIDEVLDLSASEPWSHLGELAGLDFCGAGNFVQVKIEDLFSAIGVRVWYVDFLVETTRSRRR